LGKNARPQTMLKEKILLKMGNIAEKRALDDWQNAFRARLKNTNSIPKMYWITMDTIWARIDMYARLCRFAVKKQARTRALYWRQENDYGLCLAMLSPEYAMLVPYWKNAAKLMIGTLDPNLVDLPANNGTMKQLFYKINNIAKQTPNYRTEQIQLRMQKLIPLLMFAVRAHQGKNGTLNGVYDEIVETANNMLLELSSSGLVPWTRICSQVPSNMTASWDAENFINAQLKQVSQYFDQKLTPSWQKPYLDLKNDTPANCMVLLTLVDNMLNYCTMKDWPANVTTARKEKMVWVLRLLAESTHPDLCRATSDGIFTRMKANYALTPVYVSLTCLADMIEAHPISTAQQRHIGESMACY